MLVFFGEEDAVTRSAKIKALQGFFKEPEGAIPKALSMLEDGGLNGRGSGETLIVSGHGNQNNFGAVGITGDKLYATLKDKGLAKTRFDKIYLMGCNIGLLAQDNSVVENFAKKFAYGVNTNDVTAGIKVYAPRGLVSFTTEEKPIGKSEKVLTVTKMEVVCPEKTYALSEGLTLVNPS